MTKIIKVYALSLEESTMFELFGCDIAVNSVLTVKIMEEDAKLKYRLVEDMLRITQILTSNKDEPIYSSEYSVRIYNTAWTVIFWKHIELNI